MKLSFRLEFRIIIKIYIYNKPLFGTEWRNLLKRDVSTSIDMTHYNMFYCYFAVSLLSRKAAKIAKKFCKIFDFIF